MPPATAAAGAAATRAKAAVAAAAIKIGFGAGRAGLERLRPYDFVAIGIAVAITALSAFAVYGGAFGGTEGARVIVESGDRSWVFPLDADETIRVPGPLGTTIVEIHGGHAHVVESPCDNQICVAAGEIHEPNQWIACLPNAVFVRIEGNADAEAFDASTW